MPPFIKNSCIEKCRNLNTKDEKKYTDKKQKLKTKHMNVLLCDLVWFYCKDAINQ